MRSISEQVEDAPAPGEQSDGESEEQEEESDDAGGEDANYERRRAQIEGQLFETHQDRLYPQQVVDIDVALRCQASVEGERMGGLPQ